MGMGMVDTQDTRGIEDAGGSKWLQRIKEKC